jgi:hypothetical protein
MFFEIMWYYEWAYIRNWRTGRVEQFKLYEPTVSGTGARWRKQL